jgi:hypothetical protein
VRLPRRAKRPPGSPLLAAAQRTGFQRVSAGTLGEVKDKGSGAENLIWLARRQSGRANPSSLAADDILAALTGRIAELEARVLAILAEVEPEPPRVDSGSGRALSAPKADAGRGTDGVRRDARAEADDELTRASEERRMLATEMRLLREAFQEARRGQPSAGPGANAAEAQITPELRAAIADEMRSLLTELLADFRSRAAVPPPPAEHISVETETAEIVSEAPEAILEQIVEDVKTLSPTANLATEAAPLGTFESIVEDVDELVRSTSKPIVDHHVEELREPEPKAPADVFEVEVAPAEPAAATVEEFLRTEAPPPLEAIDFAAAVPEAAPPLVDEHVFAPAEPLAPIVDQSFEEVRRPEAPPPIEPVAPMVDEYIQALRRPEAPPPIETVDLSVTPPELVAPIVEEYVNDHRTELTEPIVEEYVVPKSDLTITPPAPSAPDPRIAALWDVAPSPTNEAESAPFSPVEPASFISDEFIAATRSVDMPDAAPDLPQEVAPEPIDLAPPVEFAPAPLPIVEAEPAARAEPLITDSEPASSPSSELRVADERGLHQIQIVISPIHSFPRLLETERRIRALATVNALHLRDFRNGVATLTVSVGEAISPAEFGAVIQMLEELHLRLEGSTQSSVELRAEDEPPAS